jgi:hypothetical protein
LKWAGIDVNGSYPTARRKQLMDSIEQIQKNILNEVRICMARVMDDCELEMGESPRWKFLRSRLLKMFGDRGLEGKINQIICNSAVEARNAFTK